MTDGHFDSLLDTSDKWGLFGKIAIFAYFEVFFTIFTNFAPTLINIGLIVMKKILERLFDKFCLAKNF